MKTLRALTSGSCTYTQIRLPARAVARIHSWVGRFPAATGKFDVGLSHSYRSKPLVDIGRGPVYGEIAIVQAMQEDGWGAVWADTYHRKFWSAMPGLSNPVELPPRLKALLERIVRSNGGKRGGCFDVIAWTARKIIFLEYKGPNDRPNKNESRWIRAALRAGVPASHLFFIGAKAR